MVGNAVLKAQAAEPPIGEIDLNVTADLALRADLYFGAKGESTSRCTARNRRQLMDKELTEGKRRQLAALAQTGPFRLPEPIAPLKGKAKGNVGRPAF